MNNITIGGQNLYKYLSLFPSDEFFGVIKELSHFKDF